MLHCVSIVMFYVYVIILYRSPYCMCLGIYSPIQPNSPFPRYITQLIQFHTNLRSASSISYTSRNICINLSLSFTSLDSHRHPAILQIVDALSCRLWLSRRTTAPCTASRRIIDKGGEGVGRRMRCNFFLARLY